ncbi:hypothetical protein FQR65_LT08053 [Abscondita terminalis]|nr:hypothetical protein FQR65_LT08053 [Abscondita terminalis]
MAYGYHMRFILYLCLCCKLTPVATYRDENLDKCVSRVIENVFTKDEVVVLVYDQIVTLELPRLTQKPYVIARSTYSTLMKLDKRSAFVIHLGQPKTLQSTLAFLTNSTLWTSSRRSNNAHFLFIINGTNSEDVSYIFEQLWNIRIYHFVVLTCCTKSKQLIEVYTRNPFHKENGCGIKAKGQSGMLKLNNNISVVFSTSLEQSKDVEQVDVLSLTVVINVNMAASENCLFDPGQSIDKNSVYKIAKKCACGAIAKSGVQCVQCKCIYHNSCVNRIKYCCEVLLVAPNLEIKESTAESEEDCYPSKEITYLKEIIQELRFSNKLLQDKVNALDIENCYLRDKLFIPNSNQLSVSKTSQIVIERHNVSNQHGKEAVKYPSTKHLQKLKPSNTNRTPNKLTNGDTYMKSPTVKDIVQDEPHIEASNVIESIPNAESWTEVVKRKPKLTNTKQGNEYIKKTIRGTANWGNDNFSAFPSRVWLYVGRAKIDSNAEAISKYLVNKFPNQEFIVEKLDSKSQITCSFKVGAEFSLKDDLLNPDVWPKGILVRRFNFFRSRSQEAKP